MVLPKGWSASELRHSIRIHAGVAPGQLAVRLDGSIPYVKVEDLNNCEKTQITSRTFADSDRFAIPRKAVIFPKRGAAIFSNKVRIAGVPMVLDTNLMAVECKADLDPDFLYYAVTYAGLYKLADTSTIPQLNNKHILPYVLLRPFLAEQRRIVRVLETWDESISTAEKLLNNSRRQKRELMRRLLSGKKRLASPSSAWQYMDFEHVFERVSQKNALGNANVLTISGQDGLVSQCDYFKKSVASDNLAGYTLLKRNDFAYNKSYSSGYPLGAIKPLLDYDSGVVSSLYICFRLRQSLDADFDFFRHYFEAGLLNEEISGIAQEGARNHGLLNVSVTDFFKLRLHVPPAPLQRKIAEVINAAEAEERLFEHQLELLLEEKRALMQQLLTGKRRVRLSAADTKAAA